MHKSVHKVHRPPQSRRFCATEHTKLSCSLTGSVEKHVLNVGLRHQWMLKGNSWLSAPQIFALMGSPAPPKHSLRPTIFFHSTNAQHKRQRERGRRAGGIARSHCAATLPADLPIKPLACVADVLNLLHATAHEVRCRQLETRTANCVGYLCSVALNGLSQIPTTGEPNTPRSGDALEISKDVDGFFSRRADHANRAPRR